MNILYCCKIISDNRLSDELIRKRKFKSHGYISRPYLNIEKSNTDKLIESLESIENIKFKNAIFYIDIDDIKNEKDIQNIKEKLNEINAENKIIKYERPKVKEEWISLIEKIINMYGDDLYLINMNHDHKLVGNISTITNILNFIKKENIKNTLVAYTHNNELIAKCIVNKSKYKIINENKYYIFNAKIDWYDSLYICSLSLIKQIFNNIKTPKENYYLPRPDWPGVYVKPVKVTYIIPQEIIFKHIDGFNHVSSYNFKLLSNSLIHSDDVITEKYEEFLDYFYLTFYRYTSRKIIDKYNFIDLYRNMICEYIQMKKIENDEANKFISFAMLNYIVVNNFIVNDIRCSNNNIIYNKINNIISHRLKVKIQQIKKLLKND
jgi:hypothetical protein